MGALPAFFAKTATLYNPLIYIGFNRQVGYSSSANNFLILYSCLGSKQTMALFRKIK